ncbi:MAG: outer membrane protein [Beijerinckiaceae bacterium]
MTNNLFAGLAPKALAALAVLTLASGALGADLPSRSSAAYYPAPPIFTWTGLYLGANGGYGIGRGTYGGGADFGDQAGGIFGVTAGYNYQSGSLVAGIEADLDFAGIAGTSIPKASTFTSGDTTSVGTLRGRFGYAVDRALFYFTGGYTGANMRGSLADNSTNPNLFFNQSNYLNGYVLGLGLEYALTNNVSVKAEYLYSYYGKANYFGGTVDSINAGTNFSTLKAGVNYHF